MSVGHTTVASENEPKSFSALLERIIFGALDTIGECIKKSIEFLRHRFFDLYRKLKEMFNNRNACATGGACSGMLSGFLLGLAGGPLFVFVGTIVGGAVGGYQAFTTCKVGDGFLEGFVFVGKKRIDFCREVLKMAKENKEMVQILKVLCELFGWKPTLVDGFISGA